MQTLGKAFASPAFLDISKRIACNANDAPPPPPSFGVDLQFTGNKEALIINYRQNPENINIFEIYNSVVLYQNCVVIVQSSAC